MPKYATETGVPICQTKTEIERTLERYGATAFGYGTKGNRATIVFELAGRPVQITLTMPDPDEREFTHTPAGHARATTQAQVAYDQACRQRWRALALVIKAKLEAGRVRHHHGRAGVHGRARHAKRPDARRVGASADRGSLCSQRHAAAITRPDRARIMSKRLLVCWARLLSRASDPAISGL